MKYLQIPSILKLGRKGMTREREGREVRGQEGKDQDAQHFNCTLNCNISSSSQDDKSNSIIHRPRCPCGPGLQDKYHIPWRAVEKGSTGRGLQLTPRGDSAPKAKFQATTQIPKNSRVPRSPEHQEFSLPLCPRTLKSQVVMEAVLVLRFSQGKLSCVLGSEFVDVAFFYIAIYPEDCEGSNNYLEGWKLLTA